MSVQPSVHHGCQRDSFWLTSCMCTSTAHASLLPAAERATRPTANISTPPRCSASARKWRVQSSSMSLSDCLELLGEHAHMYPQGTRKGSKVGCKAHRAQLRTHQNGHCIFRREEYHARDYMYKPVLYCHCRPPAGSRRPESTNSYSSNASLVPTSTSGRCRPSLSLLSLIHI